MKKADLLAAQLRAEELRKQLARPETPLTEEGVFEFANRLGIPTEALVKLDNSDRPLWQAVVTVTPAMATEWLARYNTMNRPLTQGKIRQFADDMTTGNWKLTHQGIAFDHGERLQDGQNRLEACVLASVPFTTLVFIGLTDEARMVVDTGTSRKTYAQSTLAGIAMTPRAEAVSRMIAAGIDDPKNTRLISTQTVIGYYAQFKHSIDFAIVGLEQAPKGAKNASVMAAFAKAHASGTFSEDDLKGAMEVVVGLKVEYNQRYQPIVQLVRWLTGATPNRKAAKVDEVLRKTLRALKAFQDKESISTIHAVTDDPYPLEFESVSND